MEEHIEPVHNDSPEALQSPVFGVHHSAPPVCLGPPRLIHRNEEAFGPQEGGRFQPFLATHGTSTNSL